MYIESKILIRPGNIAGSSTLQATATLVGD